MKKSLLALCLGVSLPCVALAQLTPVIDPEWKAVDLKMKQEDKQKCSHMNVIKEQRCSMKLYSEYTAKGVIPGTEEYIRKNYGSLSVTQLRDVITQMDHKYAGKVRFVEVGDMGGGPEPGEITHDILVGNVTFLHKLIDEKGGEQDPLDTIYGQKTKHYRFQ